jgi:uncharacterized lipoprotein
MLEGDRIDYKSAEKARGPRLEVPPDLTQLQRDNRYAIPEANKGVATASGYQLEQQNKPTTDVTWRRPPRATRSASSAMVRSAGWWSSRPRNSCGRRSRTSGRTAVS